MSTENQGRENADKTLSKKPRNDLSFSLHSKSDINGRVPSLLFSTIKEKELEKLKPTFPRDSEFGDVLNSGEMRNILLGCFQGNIEMVESTIDMFGVFSPDEIHRILGEFSSMKYAKMAPKNKFDEILKLYEKHKEYYEYYHKKYNMSRNCELNKELHSLNIQLEAKRKEVNDLVASIDHKKEELNTMAIPEILISKMKSKDITS